MKLKHYVTALVPICLVVFVFRAIELILCIDPHSQHFESGTILPTVFNILLVIVALFFASVLFKKNEPKPATVRLAKPSLFDLIIGVGTSLTMIAYALFRLITALTDHEISLNKIHTAPQLWQTVLAIGAAVFIIFYVTYPKRSLKKNLWRVLSLFLTGYTLFLLVTNFSDLDVVFSRSFGIYRILFYGMAAAASVGLSKIMARLIGRKGFIFFTCMMAVMMALRMADTVLYLIPDNPYGIPGDLFAPVSDLLLTLLYLSQMKKLMKGKRRPRPTEEAPEEITETPHEPTQEPLQETPEEPADQAPVHEPDSEEPVAEESVMEDPQN